MLQFLIGLSEGSLPLAILYQAPMTSSTNQLPNFWKEGEQTNGRLAMIGFFALIHNYVLFGWIIPGIF